MIRDFWPCLRLHVIFMKKKDNHRTEKKNLILLKSTVVNVVFSFLFDVLPAPPLVYQRKKSNNAFSDDCDGPDFDVYRIVYVLYALQLCSFVQAVWARVHIFRGRAFEKTSLNLGLAARCFGYIFIGSFVWIHRAACWIETLGQNIDVLSRT